MTILATLPRQVYAAGTYSIPSTSIPDGLTTLKATLQRNSWPDTGSNVISASFDISYDGGATWPETWAYTAAGGVTVYKGNVDPVSTMTIPLKAGTGRRLRGMVTLFVSLDTSVTVEGF